MPRAEAATRSSGLAEPHCEIEAIEFVESFSQLGAGQGGYNEDHEFYGYREPI